MPRPQRRIQGRSASRPVRRPARALSLRPVAHLLVREVCSKEPAFTLFANRVFTVPQQDPEHDHSRAFRETCRRPLRRRRLTPVLKSGSRIPTHGNPDPGFAADHLDRAGRARHRLWRGRRGQSCVLFARRVPPGGRGGALQHPQQHAGRQRSGCSVPISTQRLRR